MKKKINILLDSDVNTLSWPPRIRRVFERGHIKIISDIYRFNHSKKRKLLSLHGMGPKAYELINEVLEKRKLPSLDT